MRKLLATIDDLIRGSATRNEILREGRIPVPAGTAVRALILLGAIYGVFMGLYGVLRPKNPSLTQLVASAVKVPLLFLLTLAVTLPSLYVCSALARSRLGLHDTLRLLLVGNVISVALLASFGPVTGFFTLSTTSYPFMIVLNVVLFAAAGLAGLAFLRKAVDVIFAPQGEPARPGDAARRVFLAWAVVYGVVGAQMGWILRPFIGTPDEPFTLFRPRQSSFFEAVLLSLRQLLS
jgi:hypothetical protein